MKLKTRDKAEAPVRDAEEELALVDAVLFLKKRSAILNLCCRTPSPAAAAVVLRVRVRVRVCAALHLAMMLTSLDV